MKIGFVGLGKLGLPCAVGASLRGHEVMGYDVNTALMSKEPRGYLETGPDGKVPFNPFLESSTITFGSLRQVCEHSEIIFVAVQTPHEPKFEGTTPLTDERKDFDYRYVESAMSELAKIISRDTIIVLISTVLPGTVRERVGPLLTSYMKLCYNPYFIAMGTTMHDFYNPEFILLGGNDADAKATLQKYYATISTAQVFSTTIENAELIKVAYNTYIGMKIAFANTMMEICHKTPNTDVNEVTKALSLGHRRIMSDRYLYGGMGDGGGCHPRDNIALSWLSRKLNLSFDWFHSVMYAREKQTQWLANLMCQYTLPKMILGYSFKPESNITVGSPAILLQALLQGDGVPVAMHDPVVESQTLDLSSRAPHVFLIGTNHQIFKSYNFPKGSVILDPWRYMPDDIPGVLTVHIGKSTGINPEAALQAVSGIQMQLKNSIEAIESVGRATVLSVPVTDERQVAKDL